MAVITIRRDDSGNLVFDPNEVTLDPTGDFVTWANADDKAPHQPTMQGKAKDYWLDDPLPPYVEGQPMATSPAVALTPLPAGVAYLSCGDNLVCVTYVDGLDPDAATGTIAIPVGTNT
jgi:hypothetical protein